MCFSDTILVFFSSPPFLLFSLLSAHLFVNVVIPYTFSLPHDSLRISNYNEQKMPIVPKCLETVFVLITEERSAGGIQWE